MTTTTIDRKGFEAPEGCLLFTQVEIIPQWGASGVRLLFLTFREPCLASASFLSSITSVGGKQQQKVCVALNAELH